jgi:hypothetical protein
MNWRIRGTVTGHYGCDVLIRAHLLETGAMVAETVVNTGVYALGVPDGSPCYIALLPLMGCAWLPGRGQYIGDKVYPNNPAGLPYYFQCVGAGITGTHEPALTADPLVSIQDGSCVWERVERIPTPIINSPILPEPF